jgi:hypothetical protein
MVGGVFWFAFGRAPRRRSDGGLTQHEAGNYASFLTRDGGDQQS